MPPFIATYGMLWVCSGVTYYYMGGGAIYGFPRGFRTWARLFFNMPIPIYVMVLFSSVGTACSPTAPSSVRRSSPSAPMRRRRAFPAFRCERRLIFVYAISGAMAGLAAVVYLARVNSAEAGIGEPLLLPAIAAVLIGGTSLFGGIGSLFGTMVGALC